QPAIGDPQTAWTSPRAQPLADAAAAALITPRPETAPANAAANDYVPTASELRAFRAARDPAGQTRVQVSRLFAHVTGRPGLEHPSTDELIQWAAHKWGIPEDVLRAQVQHESGARMSQLGDRAG